MSGDGRRLAVMGETPGRVTVWSVPAGEKPSAFAGTLTNAVFSPDGQRLATVDEKSTVQVWDTDTGGELLWFNESRRTLMHLGFSPDGFRLGVAGADGRGCFVKIWDGAPRHEDPAKR